MILSTCLFITLSITCYVAKFNDNVFLSFTFLIFSILCFITSISCLRDYKYLSGKLKESQFKRHSQYQYWYYIYGKDAYQYYLKRYK